MRNIDEMLEMAERAVRARYETGAEFFPTVLMFGSRPNEICELPFGWDGPAMRRMMLNAIRRTLVDVPQTQAYLICTESWLAAYEVDEKSPLAGGVMPEDKPDRTETLMLLAATRAGERKWRVFDLERGETGKVVKMTLRDDLEVADWGGELVKLFEAA